METPLPREFATVPGALGTIPLRYTPARSLHSLELPCGCEDQSPELWRKETTYSFSGHPSGRLITTGLCSLRKRNPRELGMRGTHLHSLLHKETEVSIKEYILSDRGAVLGFSVGIVGRRWWTDKGSGQREQQAQWLRGGLVSLGWELQRWERALWLQVS